MTAYHTATVDVYQPPVVKDALKILLLTHLLKNPGIQGMYTSREERNEGYRSVPALNGIGIQACVESLIEKILPDLLPRLQNLLLQRYDTNWAVVVSAMTALSMNAEEWVYCNSAQYLDGRLSNFENAWNVLLGLYAAAYGGYYLLRANSANRSRIAQSDKTALMLLNELKIWVEHDGIPRHHGPYLLIGLQLTPKQVMVLGAGRNISGSTRVHP